ncbi:hypothetical protein T07_12218 [Trichinella nelsoni]|uniref:Uncharacterized protein n=1 Tax=Trichinella nelsoni TaxID=6336 RepID=A0A0V0S0X9_9BILA|nr:hypothetical protein T07_12218 [Trichinella nelsoni]
MQCGATRFLQLRISFIVISCANAVLNQVYTLSLNYYQKAQANANGNMNEYFDYIRLFCSLQCCQSGALSTIFPLFKSNQEIVIHQMLKTKKFIVDLLRHEPHIT